MIRHCLLVLMMAGLIYALTPSVIAQDNSSSDQSGQSAAPAGRHHMDPEARTQMLTKHLNLTSDQQTKVLDIFKSEQSQMESLHSDTSLSQQDRRSKMMDIHKSTNDQVRALLTPDQQKKFDEMESKRGQWGHHQGGQTPPASDSPQQ
jgi:periplasmic protein CpxP/Spy